MRLVKVINDKVFILDKSSKNKWIVKAIDKLLPLKLRKVGTFNDDISRNLDMIIKLEKEKSVSSDYFYQVCEIVDKPYFNIRIFNDNVIKFCDKHNIPITTLRKFYDVYKFSFSEIVSKKKIKKLYKYLKKYEKSYNGGFVGIFETHLNFETSVMNVVCGKEV